MPSIISTKTSGGGGIAVTGDTSGIMQLASNDGTTAVTIDASQNVGIGTASPAGKLEVVGEIVIPVGGTNGIAQNRNGAVSKILWKDTTATDNLYLTNPNGSNLILSTNDIERMRIDSIGEVMVGRTTSININSSTDTGFQAGQSGGTTIYRSGGTVLYVGRQTNDGILISFAQGGVQEGNIAVSGTTVSYNGGHLSRWSQLYNETTQVEVYRGTVLESVDAMCEWYKDGELLPNEQVTKTIVSTTPASKAVAGVFDMYDHDDEDNPYDFYVAQSGDFVIRVAAGTVVQNGDLLESAGNGTARVQADDICRSSTIAKVTSNYVSETYADGSFCVPCILMIG
jgi:hypothetical protein